MSDPSSEGMPRAGFIDGLRAALKSIFFYVLLGHYSSIGALSSEFGFDPVWMVLCTLLIWAAPAQVIVISTLGTATLIEVAIAVTLSSVRLLPMVGALLPMLQRDGTRSRDLILPMHLTAISVWAEGMRLLPGVPKQERIAFYNGLRSGSCSRHARQCGWLLLAARLRRCLPPRFVPHPDVALDVLGAQHRTLVDGRRSA